MKISKGRATRQKMINLMYLVFIAMLALNVSTEVLDGFDLVNENLQQTIQTAETRNEQIYTEIEVTHNANRKKTKEAFDAAMSVKAKTDSLYNYINELKEKITAKSGGIDEDLGQLKSRDNLDASSEVMISTIGGKHGYKLQKAIETYRHDMMGVIKDEDKRKIVEKGLSTDVSKRAKADNKDWVTASFERMPSIATLTYLTELQVNIKQAEGEALNNLLKNIDFSDLRVNDVKAIIVPDSKIVMSGTNYSANIFMAAVDTTQDIRVFANGKAVNGDIFREIRGVGTWPVKGYVEMDGRDGSIIRKDFETNYTVIAPMATIAPLLMDVVYSGIKNPVSISVPGVPSGSVQAQAKGGRLERDGNNWNAYPTGVGGKFTIDVYANTNGGNRLVATKEFRIRALPDPTAYIEYKDDKGNSKYHKRGPISRSVLLNNQTLKAAIDDGILNIGFTVLSFRTFNRDAMGNVAPEMSDGPRFSARQQEQIRRMSRGEYFYIVGIRVKGPDGSERDISPMELRIN